MTVGCKLLRRDYTSLRPHGRVTYTRDWTAVPGNGAYVAVTGGLIAGGMGDVLVYLECEEPTGARALPGVVCYRRVRIVDPCPERVSPELRGELARYAPDLAPDQRVALAMESTPEWRGELARWDLGLTPDQRYLLALETTPEMRGEIAWSAIGLDARQRFSLALKSTPWWRGRIACYADALTGGQRFALAMRSTPMWRAEAAWYAPCLSPGQRSRLARAGGYK